MFAKRERDRANFGATIVWQRIVARSNFDWNHFICGRIVLITLVWFAHAHTKSMPTSQIGLTLHFALDSLSRSPAALYRPVHDIFSLSHGRTIHVHTHYTSLNIANNHQLRNPKQNTILTLLNSPFPHYPPTAISNPIHNLFSTLFQPLYPLYTSHRASNKLDCSPTSFVNLTALQITQEHG